MHCTRRPKIVYNSHFTCISIYIIHHLHMPKNLNLTHPKECISSFKCKILKNQFSWIGFAVVVSLFQIRNTPKQKLFLFEMASVGCVFLYILVPDQNFITWIYKYIQLHMWEWIIHIYIWNFLEYFLSIQIHKFCYLSTNSMQ